jgi:sugar lactone lactonase YvrE
MRLLCTVLFTFLLFAPQLAAQTGFITTVAGGGSPPDGLGDGGPATSARLIDPSGLAFDSAGHLFISDTHHNRVRRVDAVTNIITTVAGDGTAFGTLGNGGPATLASVTQPIGLAIDAFDNLYFTDGNPRFIRRVDAGADGLVTGAPGVTDEIITTVFATTGNPEFFRPHGLVFDAFGNLFISDTGRARIYRADPGPDGEITAGDSRTLVAGVFSCCPSFSGDGGPALNARLRFPYSLWFDSDGNLFIADVTNNRIRRVGHGGDGKITGVADEIINTVAGTGIFSFNGDNIPASSAHLALPFGVTVAADNNVYIADSLNNRVRQVVVGADGLVTRAGDEIITTVAGGPFLFQDGVLATQSAVGRPIALAFDAAGNLYIATHFGGRVRRVEALGPPVVADTDDDGVLDVDDNCPDDSNPDQTDTDLNGDGDGR